MLCLPRPSPAIAHPACPSLARFLLAFPFLSFVLSEFQSRQQDCPLVCFRRIRLHWAETVMGGHNMQATEFKQASYHARTPRYLQTASGPLGTLTIMLTPGFDPHTQYQIKVLTQQIPYLSLEILSLPSGRSPTERRTWH